MPTTCNGLDGTGAPSDEPLRLTLETDAGVSALRLPYTSTRGSHGFGFAQPSQPGDQNSLALNQIAYYFMTGGQEMSDDICMADFSCDWLPNWMSTQRSKKQMIPATQVQENNHVDLLIITVSHGRTCS